MSAHCSGVYCRAATLVLGATLLVAPAFAAGERHFSFGYDQPHTTGYGIAADMFAAKLSELSKGKFVIDQFPGAQLGQEPQMLQKIRTGDIDFIISSTANASTVSPQSGVFSLHYIFTSDEQLAKALADPTIVKAMRDMFDETVKGARVLGLATLGLRQFYGRKEIRSVADMKGLKVRVQATATEDTLLPAYGAQTVHMPFGDVYTALQTGVVDMAENGINVYLSNKHYEAAPIMSLTGHEANNSVIWVSDKVWSSLSPEEQGYVQAAADEVSKNEPAKAIELERQSITRLKKIGVKFSENVDKSGFIAASAPVNDKLAEQLGPHAVKVLALVRAVK
jgi:tripartite ATP-independent transporter DctP family solute receptor